MTRQEIVDRIRELLNSGGINSPLLQAAILANIDKESGYILRSENLNYSNTSNERIRKIFGSRVRSYSDAELNYLKSDPALFAEAVYGMKTQIGRGMGNMLHGDGWKYRGRGFIQITGKVNYKSIGDRLGVDLVENPDLILTDEDIGLRSTVEFFIRDLRHDELSPDSLETACRIATRIVGGRGLNLDSGYGAELLAKVIGFARKYLQN